MSCSRLELKCRLTSPFLGQRRQGNGVRAFDTEERDGKTYFLPDVPQWRWALGQAMGSHGLIPASNVDFVRLPTRILSPAIRLYTRVWDSKNPSKRETFQAYQAGTVITFSVFLLDELEQKGSNGLVLPQRPLTEEEVRECFATIGEHIGLSPWGSKFGYGRFLLTGQQS